MDFSKELDNLERQIELLRARYVMYFSGRDHWEPLQYRWRVDGMLRRLQKEHCTNSALNNRLRGIIMQLGNYHSLWNRLARKKRMEKTKTAEREIDDAVKQELESMGVSDVDALKVPGISKGKSAGDESARAAEDAVPGATGEIPEGPFSDGGEPEESEIDGELAAAGEPEAVEQAADMYGGLYAEYIEARRQTGEATTGFSRESFEKQIRDQEAALAGKYPGKKFEFSIVISGGKVSIKAVAK
jgi:hypothetical protein